MDEAPVAPAAHEPSPGLKAAAGVYGSILVAAVIAALSEKQASAGRLAASVAATGIVFWLAHVWSDGLGEYAATGRRPGAARLAVLASQQWPMLQAELVPLLALLVGAVGAYSDETAVTISLALAVAQLFVWGYAAGSRGHERRRDAIFSALITGGLGLVLVLLKIAVH
jgi:hypothetical protein